MITEGLKTAEKNQRNLDQKLILEIKKKYPDDIIGQLNVLENLFSRGLISEKTRAKFLVELYEKAKKSEAGAAEKKERIKRGKAAAKKTKKKGGKRKKGLDDKDKGKTEATPTTLRITRAEKAVIDKITNIYPAFRNHAIEAVAIRKIKSGDERGKKIPVLRKNLNKFLNEEATEIQNKMRQGTFKGYWRGLRLSVPRGKILAKKKISSVLRNEIKKMIGTEALSLVEEINGLKLPRSRKLLVAVEDFKKEEARPDVSHEKLEKQKKDLEKLVKKGKFSGEKISAINRLAFLSGEIIVWRDLMNFFFSMEDAALLEATLRLYRVLNKASKYEFEKQRTKKPLYTLTNLTELLRAFSEKKRRQKLKSFLKDDKEAERAEKEALRIAEFLSKKGRGSLKAEGLVQSRELGEKGEAIKTEKEMVRALQENKEKIMAEIKNEVKTMSEKVREELEKALSHDQPFNPAAIELVKEVSRLNSLIRAKKETLKGLELEKTAEKDLERISNQIILGREISELLKRAEEAEEQANRLSARGDKRARRAKAELLARAKELRREADNYEKVLDENWS
jgi:hypothetical protein